MRVLSSTNIFFDKWFSGMEACVIKLDHDSYSNQLTTVKIFYPYCFMTYKFMTPPVLNNLTSDCLERSFNSKVMCYKMHPKNKLMHGTLNRHFFKIDVCLFTLNRFPNGFLH